MTGRIAPCLWFDGRAEEAVAFYGSLFPDTRVLARLNGADGGVMFIEFSLAGQRFQAVNGGPEFPFSNAVSLSVSCDTQAEIDRLWGALTADGGAAMECGWCRDKFGLPWQIVPAALTGWMREGAPDAVARLMAAVWSMAKLDVAALEAAYRGDPGASG